MKNLAILCLGSAFLSAPSISASAKEKDKDATPLGVTARTAESVMTIAPGDRGYIPSACASGEVVVGGGPTGIPAAVDIVYSTLFTDGVNSGWAVEWKNNGAETVVAAASTTALCMKGTITLAQPTQYPTP